MPESPWLQDNEKKLLKELAIAEELHAGVVQVLHEFCCVLVDEVRGHAEPQSIPKSR